MAVAVGAKLDGTLHRGDLTGVASKGLAHHVVRPQSVGLPVVLPVNLGTLNFHLILGKFEHSGLSCTLVDLDSYSNGEARMAFALYQTNNSLKPGFRLGKAPSPRPSSSRVPVQVARGPLLDGLDLALVFLTAAITAMSLVAFNLVWYTV